MRRAPVPPAPQGGVGLAVLLTVLFIGLKLAGAIGWSWWWVLSPIWIGYAIVLLIVAICLLWAVMS
jgi:membrane protein YdbS with pleckstrin-like domain